MHPCHVANAGMGGEKENHAGWCGRTSAARSLGRWLFSFWGEKGQRPSASLDRRKTAQQELPLHQEKVVALRMDTL